MRVYFKKKLYPSKKELPLQPTVQPADLAGNNQNRRIIPLSVKELLVETVFGFYLVAPSYNIDVAIGVVRDGIIEPWTTNVVRRLLKENQVYINLGANFGYYAALGAQLVGRKGKVYAIEANPHIFVFLLKTMYWSGYPDVIHAYNLAIYSEDDCALDFIFDPQYLGNGAIDHLNPLINNQLFAKSLKFPSVVI